MQFVKNEEEEKEKREKMKETKKKQEEEEEEEKKKKKKMGRKPCGIIQCTFLHSILQSNSAFLDFVKFV
ncbi:hypothetical protein M8J76_000072 [Diaphorina citri]|nr:hypothetical protein M8J76_000072 [Diaphorina citri]